MSLRRRTRPVDPNTVIPPVVAANAAVADELQKKFIEEQAQASGEENQEERQEEHREEHREERREAPPPPPPADDESWQSRYNSMKGRYDRQGDQIKSLTGQLTSMQRVIDQLSMQPRPRLRPPPQATRLLTEDEVNDFGPEFLDVVGRTRRRDLRARGRKPTSRRSPSSSSRSPASAASSSAPAGRT